MIRIGDEKTYLIRHLSSGKVARDTKLSHLARGVFFFVNQYDDWEVVDLDKMTHKEHGEQVTAALHELEQAGYLFLAPRAQIEQIEQVGGI